MSATSTLNEETISHLVHAIYDRIRDDEILGPIFERVIGDQWTPHLAKMCDFWSSVMLSTGRFHGNPMMAHMRLKDVRPEHFERWLSMFRATASEVCPGELGDLFADRTSTDPAEEAADQLRRDRVREALSSLPDVERRILELRFGFEGEGRTLEDAIASTAFQIAIALSALMFVPDALQVVCAQALRARGDVWVPTITHLASYVVVMAPLAWFLALPMKLGLAGIVWAVIAASFLSAGLLLTRFWRLSVINA